MIEGLRNVPVRRLIRALERDGFANCALRYLGDTCEGNAQSAGRVREGRRSTPLGRARGEGPALAVVYASAGAFPANEALRREVHPASATLSIGWPREVSGSIVTLMAVGWSSIITTVGIRFPLGP